MDVAGECVPFYASDARLESVSSSDMSGGSAVPRDYAAVVRYGSVVGRDVSRSVATDESCTPLTGAPHKVAGPASGGAHDPGESTVSHGSACKFTELQDEISTSAPIFGGSHDSSASDAPRETAETAEKHISGTERPSPQTRKPLAPASTRLTGEIGGIPLFPVSGLKPPVGAQACSLGANASPSVNDSQSAKEVSRTPIHTKEHSESFRRHYDKLRSILGDDPCRSPCQGVDMRIQAHWDAHPPRRHALRRSLNGFKN